MFGSVFKSIINTINTTTNTTLTTTLNTLNKNKTTRSKLFYSSLAVASALSIPSIFSQSHSHSSNQSSISQSSSSNNNTNTTTNNNNHHCPSESDLERKAQRAFQDCSTWSLLRSLIVFQLCKFPAIVDYTPSIISLAHSLHLTTPLFFIIRHSFFAQFCGGESANDVVPLISRLYSHGILTILDLSIESDDTQSGQSSNSQSSIQSSSQSTTIDDTTNTTFTKVERVIEMTKECIDMASFQPGTFIAVKVTAFGSPHSLQAVSGMLSYTRDIFDSCISSNSSGNITDTTTTNTDTNTDSTIEYKSFESVLKSLPGSVGLKDGDIRGFFKMADTDNDGRIGWLDFTRVINLDSTPHLFLGSLTSDTISSIINSNSNSSGTTTTNTNTTTTDTTTTTTNTTNNLYSFSEKCLPSVDSQDLMEVKMIENRLDNLCQYAVQKGVKIMFDAEQSHFQPTIHYISLKLMQKYNKLTTDTNNDNNSNVYITYQMYLKDGLSTLKTDLQDSIDKKYLLAAKLVRGAYMTSEKKRSDTYGIRYPIHSTITETHTAYDTSLTYLLTHPSPHIKLIVASHNLSSMDTAISLIRSNQIDAKDGKVMFGQLYGMHDYVTYLLVSKGFIVAKYVPYGPITEVIPYLLRRAQENRTILSSSVEKRFSDPHLIWCELRRRFGCGCSS